jgi:hypothetical protein
MKTTLAIAGIAMGLGIATLPAHAQGYVVNGRAASPAEVHLLVSSGAQPGQWLVDGLGIAPAGRAQSRQAPPDRSDRKCWYVLDVLLCE